MFRVVPDQLRLSEGWVRCGQCEHVFDANAQIVAEPMVAASPVPAPPPFVHAPAEPVPPALMHDDDAHAQALEYAEDELSPVDIHLDVDIPQARPEPLLVRAAEYHALEGEAPVPVDELVVDPLAVSSPAEIGLDALSIHPGRAPNEPLLDSSVAAIPVAEPQPDDIALPPVAPPAPTFMHKPMPSTSVWHRSSVRVALALLSLLLLALLGGQVALQERDRIAAMQPSLKPVLSAACQALLGCSVSAFKQIDGIVIDSSSFTKLRGDAYRLNLVVKNTTATELAAPAIELTLTDSQDKPVLRRVLPSREFDIPAATVGAGADWTASLAVSVKSGGGNERISGYRVLAFYP